MNDYTEALYELEAGNETKIGAWWVMRVPGGWIFSGSADTELTSVFVPFSKEFQHE